MDESERKFVTDNGLLELHYFWQSHAYLVWPAAAYSLRLDQDCRYQSVLDRVLKSGLMSILFPQKL